MHAAGLQWHVQVAGTGAPLLLVHGTGGATHSWRDVFPMLASTYTVIAPDLPGHGFTERPADDGVLTLTGMAAALRDLLHALGVAPRVIVGHSAGDGDRAPDVRRPRPPIPTWSSGSMRHSRRRPQWADVLRIVRRSADPVARVRHVRERAGVAARRSPTPRWRRPAHRSRRRNASCIARSSRRRATSAACSR